MQLGDYSYTQVWKPLSATQPTGVNPRPSPVDLRCHHHFDNKTAITRHGQNETDCGVFPSVTTASSARPGYMCKDYLYESPSFESGGTDGTLHWSPYYWHGVTPCMFVSRPQQQSSPAVAAAHPYALPKAVYDSSDRIPLNQQQDFQQQQQQQHYQHQHAPTGVRRNSSSVTLPSVGYDTATVNMAAGAVILQAARDVV